MLCKYTQTLIIGLAFSQVPSGIVLKEININNVIAITICLLFSWYLAMY